MYFKETENEYDDLLMDKVKNLKDYIKMEPFQKII